ncbi:unnamed protein product [Fraxinus pennsylvanica]|uniref:Uncharacterized protein n=1 Tax=Fraxinus pennsylvanica TaxID=56036 RepID=A0AAD2DKM0_9LAMI|nr:unnamed protein product [Fraxinus pennsylvanica]
MYGLRRECVLEVGGAGFNLRAYKIISKKQKNVHKRERHDQDKATNLHPFLRVQLLLLIWLPLIDHPEPCNGHQSKRLYTGIHALKPKPKFKTGAISESTTALNIGQKNTVIKSVDQKNAVSGAAAQLPSPLAPKFENGQDFPAALTSSTETGVSVSQKKEVALAKVPTDKKKMDARKKSLKRL